MCGKRIIPIIPKRFLGPNNEEVTDWWVVGDLLAVNLCAVGVVALKGFTYDGV